MTDLAQWSAAQLASAFSRRELSPVEATEAVLARMDAWEPAINAMYRVDRDGALAAARAAEARWHRGEPLSRLDGVSVTIKENIYTAGDPAPIGTPASDLTPKTADAPPAARVREAGCVIVGKTTMPDFGMLSSGNSSMHGRTRNPWQLDRNTSGSSSGAGAAAAAGYGPLHIGTDIGGSVRLPATHCGIYGLKPSYGRVPVDPPYFGRCAGPMTRTVGDSALLLEVLAGPDRRDYMSLPYQPVDYSTNFEGLSPRGLRFGLLLDAGVGLPTDPAVRAATEAAGRALEAAGAIVEPVTPYLTDEMFDGIHRFFEARSALDVARMSAAQRAQVLPFVLKWCTWRANEFSGADVMAAYSQVVSMREAATRVIAQHDFVISPVSPILPYEADAMCPGNDPTNALPHIAYTVALNFSEHPAASLNWHHTDDGLPIGVQIAGQRFEDLRVLRASRMLEQLRPAQRAWPDAPVA